jgi:hypothetical protein
MATGRVAQVGSSCSFKEFSFSSRFKLSGKGRCLAGASTRIRGTQRLDVGPDKGRIPRPSSTPRKHIVIAQSQRTPIHYRFYTLFFTLTQEKTNETGRAADFW